MSRYRVPGTTRGETMQKTVGLLAAKIITITFLMYSTPSHAYLDPGTGSIILQSVLAGIAVAMGVLRIYWHRLKTFVSNLTGASRNTESDLERRFAQDSEAQDEV